MATNDPNRGRNGRRGSRHRRASLREIIGFVVGLFAFVRIGSRFKRHLDANEMNHQPRQVGLPEEGPDYIAHEPGHDAVQNPEIQHEPRDVNLRPILLFAASLAVLLILVIGGLWVMFNYLEDREAPVEHSSPLLDAVPQQPPTVIDPEPQQPADFPGLQANPQRDWREMLAEQNRLLTSYEWVDQGEGVARIPIDRAMQLLLERGLPAREEADVPQGEFQQVPGLEQGHELESEGGQETRPEPKTEGTPEPER
jgi:hypothetical protein